MHLYAYTGFARSLNALFAFMEVLDERKAKGIEDAWADLIGYAGQGYNRKRAYTGDIRITKQTACQNIR